jgi:cytochrome b subunit of formate dehydrogenase
MKYDGVTTVGQPAEITDGALVRSAEGTRYYQRFSVPQRFLHAFLAVTFLGLAMTGLTLRFSAEGWATTLAHSVGGFGTVLFFHLFSAVVLTVAFLIHVANLVYRIVARKEYSLLWGSSSMVPNLKDIKDFIAQIKWFCFRGPKPAFDRYAYWDKVDYWAVFWAWELSASLDTPCGLRHSSPASSRAPGSILLY